MPWWGKIARVLRPSLRLLRDSDIDSVMQLCTQDPIGNVFVGSRVQQMGCEPRAAGGQLLGYFDDDQLVQVCWAGANLVPVGEHAPGLAQIASHLAREGRRCSSVVGHQTLVNQLWNHLDTSWGPAREIRSNQPLMVCDTLPLVEHDPDVRLGRRSDLDVLVPACVAMFTEEVGYSPLGADGGAAYSMRICEIVERGLSFVRTQVVDGEPVVVFKAEIGALFGAVAQVQGVWVHPQFRGQGLAAPGMAAVVCHLRELGYPIVSLYVNDYNSRALRTYQRVGFTQVGTFTTVLF